MAIISLVFIVYSINACAMEWIFRYIRFHQCMCHGVANLIVMILGWYVMTINILLILYQGVMIYMIGHHVRIKISVINICSDVQKTK